MWKRKKKRRNLTTTKINEETIDGLFRTRKLSSSKCFNDTHTSQWNEKEWQRQKKRKKAEKNNNILFVLSVFF